MEPTMSENKGKGTRVQPGEEAELSDDALESVAGGCQQGCSNEKTCEDYISRDMSTNPIIGPTVPLIPE
jgi:hypothetical protein